MLYKDAKKYYKRRQEFVLNKCILLCPNCHSWFHYQGL